MGSFLLGVGLGGFVDGIVLHQVLQWHHMLSATHRYPTTTIAGIEANTLADGLFHVATLIAVVGRRLPGLRRRPRDHRPRHGGAPAPSLTFGPLAPGGAAGARPTRCWSQSASAGALPSMSLLK